MSHKQSPQTIRAAKRERQRRNPNSSRARRLAYRAKIQAEVNELLLADAAKLDASEAKTLAEKLTTALAS